MRGGRDWVPAFAGTRQPIRRGGTGPDSLDHPIVAVQHRSIMATLASSSVPAITQNPDIRYLGRLLVDVIRAYGGAKIYKQTEYIRSAPVDRSEEHTSKLQTHMRTSY